MCQLYQKSMKDPDDPREQDPDDDGGVSESSYESPHGDGQPAPCDMRSKYDKVHAKWKRFAQDLVSLTLTLYDAYMSM